MRDLLTDDMRPRLEVEALSDHEFESSLEGFDGRSFGGEILAKAVMAALRTCPDRTLHSLHAYFLRPAPPGRPLRFVSHVLRDGRRLSNRRVAVMLDNRRIAEVSVSLAAELEGPAFENPGAPFDAPPPHELPDLFAVAAAQGLSPPEVTPLDWRYVEYPWLQEPSGDFGRWRAWIRPTLPLPEEQRFHDAALAYLSDHGSLGVIQRRFGSSFEWSASSSLDHALWVHRPWRWTDWVSMETRAEIAVAGRALSERLIRAPDGSRIASMAQEALFSAK